MKIAVNARFYQSGKKTGIHNYTKVLYEALQESYKENSYTFFTTREKCPLGNTKSLLVPNNSLGEALFDSILINRLIVAEKPQVFHAPCYVLPLQRNSSVKYILTIHDLSFMLHPELTEWKIRKYYNTLVPVSAKNADVILCDSQNTQKELIQYMNVPARKVFVLYPSLDPLYLSGVEHSVSDMDFGYILLVTTHPKRKNTFNAIQAFNQAKCSKYLKLLVCGVLSDRHSSEIPTLIDQLGLENKVILKGYVSNNELINLYRSAQTFLYPSFYEGFGLPVIEAMSQNCLVVSSNTSSLLEVNVNADLTFDPRNILEMANRLDYAVNLPGRKKSIIKKVARDFAIKFTPQKMAREFMDIIKEA